MNYRRIKVLVVEDEILLLRNIRKKILAVSKDFQIMGEAFNGREALNMIEKEKPDIVFTDIRMPIMNGLELAKILNENYPEIYTVIITGYDDFNYARTAITYRVHDYLLKPVKAQELSLLLKNLKNKIQKQLRTEAYSALEQALIEAPSLETIQKYPETEKSRFSCFMICFGNLHTHSHSVIETSEQEEGYEKISWEELLSSAPFQVLDFRIFPQQFRNNLLILTENPDTTPETAGRFLYSRLTELLSDTQITIVCSSSPVSLSQLHGERLRLRRKLFAALVIGQSALFTLDDHTAAELPPSILPASAVKHLSSLIETGNSAGFEETFLQMIREWEEHSYPQQWIEKVLLQLFNILQRCLYFSDKDYEKMHSSIFYSLESSRSLSCAASPMTAEFLYWISLNKSVPTEIEAVVEEMDAYIRFHYKEAINISELAEKYHFNHSYLTRVFKKQKGQSPLKLINELRINDAGRLLLTTSLSVREISEMLGFTDQHYFSRIFKDFTGLTPKEYRTGSN